MSTWKIQLQLIALMLQNTVTAFTYVPLVPDRCKLLPDPGPCEGSIPRYYLNISTRKCQQFMYGGCGGNDNRFTTEQECYQACSKVGDCPAIQGSQSGDCTRRCNYDMNCSFEYKCCSNGCGTSCESPENRVLVRAGKCPKVQKGDAKNCTEDCKIDSDCQEHYKCCNNGCGRTCQYPVFEKCNGAVRTLTYPNGSDVTCGQGPTERNCPSHATCDVEPSDDGFAVCCIGESTSFSLYGNSAKAIANTKVRLPCGITGYPSKNISAIWIKDGKALWTKGLRHYMVDHGSLVFDPVYLSDAGVYQCIGQGVHGSGSKSKSTRNVTLTVIEDLAGECPNRLTMIDCVSIRKNFKQCGNDQRCEGKDETCCETGCGHICMKRENKTLCQKERDKAYVSLLQALRKKDMCIPIQLPRCTENGEYSKTQCWDQMGICWCVHPNGTKINRTESRGYVDCSAAVKPGACPSVSDMNTNNRVCPAGENQCQSDLNCTGVQKCCLNGCAYVCMDPKGTKCPYTLYSDTELASSSNQPMMLGTSNTYTAEECTDECEKDVGSSSACVGVLYEPDNGGSCTLYMNDSLPSDVIQKPATGKNYYKRDCSRPAKLDRKNAMEETGIRICRDGSTPQCCDVSLCSRVNCPSNPETVCRINPCGHCHVEFYDKLNRPVNCAIGLSKCAIQALKGSAVLSKMTNVTDMAKKIIEYVDKDQMSPEYQIKGSTIIVGKSTVTPSISNSPNAIEPGKIFFEGPFVPKCLINGDFAGPQCHGALCFCVNSNGDLIDGTLKVGPAVCDGGNLGDTLPSHEGKLPVICPDSCSVDAECPANLGATCLADPYDECKVTFRDENMNVVHCGDIPMIPGIPRRCQLRADPGPCEAASQQFYFNTTTKKCEMFLYGGCKGNENRFPTEEDCSNTCSLCNDGGPRVCSITCFNQTCMRNPYAVCHVDPCTCQLTFTDPASGRIVNCTKATTICELRRSQDSWMRMDDATSNQETMIPQCNKYGKFVRQQCDDKGYCWCVNGIGEKKENSMEKVDNKDTDLGCPNNDTAIAVLQTRFVFFDTNIYAEEKDVFTSEVYKKILALDEDFSKITKPEKIKTTDRYEVYVDVELNSVEEVDIATMANVLENTEDSMAHVINLSDKIRPVKSETVLIRAGDFTVDFKRRMRQADPEYVSVDYTFAAQIGEPTPSGLSTTTIVIIVVVIVLVAIVIIIIIVIVVKRRSSSGKEYTMELHKQTL